MNCFFFAEEEVKNVILMKFDETKQKKVVYGNWLIEGYPQVVLFDIKSAAYKLDQWKNELWENSHIGSFISLHIFLYLSFFFFKFHKKFISRSAKQ